MVKRKVSRARNDNVSLSHSNHNKKTKRAKDNSDVCFVGKPIPAAEARAKWPHRYSSEGKTQVSASKEGKSGSKEIVMARCHYHQAKVDGVVYNLNDHAYVKADNDGADYIARIVELFETVNMDQYFTAQWFYRTEDTVIRIFDDLFDKKRVFISDVKGDNHLNCIISKVNIVQVTPHVDLSTKKRKIPSCDLYYDMKFSESYLTFSNIVNDTTRTNSNSASTISSETESNSCVGDASLVHGKTTQNKNSDDMSEWSLLDLYSGCGAMSTGLCLGASLANIKLVTRWAVDNNEHACETLKLNHPETQVRNESAKNFLNVLKGWAKLCEDFSLVGSEQSDSDPNMDEDEDEVDNEAGLVINEELETQSDNEELEVEKLVAICYRGPNEIKKPGLYFKVRWLGYGSSYDTWEPIDELSNCQELLKDFVTKGYKKKLLPLPGDANFICGGPPCQGISGFNRFRNSAAPLEDTQNNQLIVYMDIIDFLKPKYVLMENVVDLLKFSNGYLGRYAIGRLVAMNYQARYGMLAAGSYGLPQFRMRVFLWGALPTEKLPPYPLPTHDVQMRGFVPVEFEEIVVAYDIEAKCQLAEQVFLKDAIADLPPVANDENLDERKYEAAPCSEFQKYIRLKKNEMVGTLATAQSTQLYDHRPLRLNKNDYDRVCQIPKEKGANFRDLPGVLVKNNKVEWDPSVQRVLLKSGKPLVPDYAMSYVRGTSSKPFGRLWWDEIVSTVVTRAEPHNQIILHPSQDRVLTIRENARLQGFPDFYKLCGPVKERYKQVGNAVAVPVANAMGYAFGLACQGQCDDDEPLITLPFEYPRCLASSSFFAPTEIHGDSS